MADRGDRAPALAVVPQRETSGLVVEANLRWELATASGVSSTATVIGHGRRLRVQAQRPARLFATVGRAEVGRAAEMLSAAGITVDVHGLHGRVATLGSGSTNPIGLALTGSARVAPTAGGALELLWAKRSVRTSAVAMPVALAALAAFGRLRRMRG